MATNKAEALALYRLHSVDIVIVALEMYKNEGYQIIDAIHDANPDQRILTYSAVPENPSSHVSCNVCSKSNRRHRIRKPVQLDELYNEIENFDALTCREDKTDQ
jgi:response regulator RpfG family c-di-GMP phosphodiesterase